MKILNVMQYVMLIVVVVLAIGAIINDTQEIDHAFESAASTK